MRGGHRRGHTPEQSPIFFVFFAQVPAQMRYQYPSRDRRCKHHRQHDGTEYGDVKPDRVRPPISPVSTAPATKARRQPCGQLAEADESRRRPRFCVSDRRLPRRVQRRGTSLEARRKASWRPLGRFPHLPSHLRHDALSSRLECEAGSDVARHHSPAFTLATYVHLLPDDLPDPGFLDSLTCTDAAEQSPGSRWQARFLRSPRSEQYTCSRSPALARGGRRGG